ncbi:MAG: DNA-directed RNA polymerase subunit omega [Clostridia bacterium]|nr:DNA-directed RNA polymerase subunit omega [Clostridia bacterium]
MLYPAVSELEKVTQSRYALVIIAAKRARQISENADNSEVELADKPVKLAITDIANGKVAIKNGSEFAEFEDTSIVE